MISKLDRERMFRLMPEAQEYEWISDLDALGWLYHVGSLGHAIAYADLFWPSFLAHDGCIFLSHRFEKANYDSWLATTKGNRRAVETVINHVHILDLFMQRDPEPVREQVVYLGRLLREMWHAKLARDFPGQSIVVSFPEEAGDDLLGYEITCFHENTR